MARKPILIYGINYAPEPIGVGRYTGDIAQYLAAQGAKVEVISATPHYPGWKVPAPYRNRYSTEISGNIRVARCPLFLKTNMRGVWRFLAPLSFALTSAPVAVWRIFRNRPETVLCVEPTLMSAPVALLASWIAGCRTVLHVQDLEVDAAFASRHLRFEILRRIATAIELAILKRFDWVITISNRMVEKLVAKGVPRDKIVLIRNWVDLQKIRPLENANTYRDELGIPRDLFVVLYAGNIGVKQALPVLCEAAVRLENEQSILFVIAGDGPEKPDLMNKYSHLVNMRFLPVQPEHRLCELLSLANVHVLPQLPGTADLVLPSKLGGMLASGKPCIVMADAGSELYEILNGGAHLIPAGDERALSLSIGAIHAGAAESVHATPLVALFDAQRNLSMMSAVLTDTP